MRAISSSVRRRSPAPAFSAACSGRDVCHAEIEAQAQRGDRLVPIAILEMPRPLADHRHVARREPEPTPFHRTILQRSVPQGTRVRRALGQDAFHAPRDLCLGLDTHDAIDLPAVLHEQQRGDVRAITITSGHVIRLVTNSMLNTAGAKAPPGVPHHDPRPNSRTGPFRTG
jgi:hypothetical protein